MAKNWKNKKQLNLEELCDEMWNLAINDRLTCELKVRKGQLKENVFSQIWNKFIEHVFLKHKGYTTPEESIQFWNETGCTS